MNFPTFKLRNWRPSWKKKGVEITKLLRDHDIDENVWMAFFDAYSVDVLAIVEKIIFERLKDDRAKDRTELETALLGLDALDYMVKQLKAEKYAKEQRMELEKEIAREKDEEANEDMSDNYMP